MANRNIPTDHPSIRAAIEKGLILEDDPTPPPKLPKPKRVKPSHGFKLVIVLPVETPSTGNGRDWHDRDRAVKAQRQAVRNAFRDRPLMLVPFLSQAGAVAITITRLGGHCLDHRDNLRMALKAIVDEVHAWFGIDDKTDTLKIDYQQQPGGPVGVMIEMEIT
ncbi:MAG: hypothetical protein ACRDD1_07490 [Planctomycetia bacterium]